MLIIFSGLPGTGKSTIAKGLAKHLNAVYLRIDTIEQAIIKAENEDREMGPAGYFVAYVLAKENLRLGATVIADSVNPLTIIRNAWRDTALSIRASFLEVEIICSDKIEHRRRVEDRVSEVEGLTLPDWKHVTDLTYAPWNREHLTLDPCNLSADECVLQIIKAFPSGYSMSSPSNKKLAV